MDSDSVPPVQRPRFQPRIPAPLPTRRETPVLAPAGQADGVGGGKQQDGVGGGGKGSGKQQDGDTVLLAAQTPQRKRVRYNTVLLAAMYYAECKKAADAAQPHSQSHSSQPSGSSLQSQPHSQPPGTEVADSAPAAFAARFALQIENDEAWG